MKFTRPYFHHLFPFIFLLVFSTFVFGIEKTNVDISKNTIVADNADARLISNPLNIQQTRIIKQQKPHLTTEKGEISTKVQSVFNKQEQRGWLSRKAPSFLKKRPPSIKPVFNSNSIASIQLFFNGSADTSYTIGDTLTLTVNFSDGMDSASIGGYLDDGDGVLDDTKDFWTFDDEDEGDMWIYDNDWEDENDSIGVFEISFFMDPEDMGEDDDDMLFSMEGALLFFTATDGGGTATGKLAIEGSDTGHLISGAVDPATPSFFVVAIPSWASGMEDDDNEGPTEVWAAVTDTNGAYNIHVQDPGMYFILAFDMFGVTDPQLFAEDFWHEVVVFDTITDVDINLVGANAWIAGNVADQDGTPVSDILVWANNGPFDVEVTTDASGDYTLGVMAMDDPFGDENWKTMWFLNVEEDDLWPDYMMTYEREVHIGTGDYVDDPDLTHFTLYENDATISGSIIFPAELDVECFGVHVNHHDGQVFNWIDFCEGDGYTSPVSYSIPVSSHLDPDEFGIGMWIDGDEDSYVRIPEGHQASSGATGIDFELVLADARFEGQVFSAVDDFPIEHAWISIHNESVAINRGTDYDGYFSLPALGDSWYAVDVGAEGFEHFHMDSIYISTGDTVWLDVPMEYGGGDFMGPHLDSVEDVPDDQGNRVRIQWDSGNPSWWGYFTGFSVWRHVNDTDDWDFVRMVPWHGHGGYSTVVPTLGNATPSDTTWSVYVVTAHTEDPNFFIDSNPMAGFSVDNLHPSPPLGLLAAYGDGNLQVELSWQPVDVPDFDYFTVYRGTTIGFQPGDPYDFTVDTAFVDNDLTAGEDYYYVVTAMDFNGNESDFSSEASASPLSTDNESFTPDKYGLSQNFPNPFNPVTTISYDLPKESKVTLIVYDILGNEVRTMVNENMPAGRYRYQLNASNLTSGIYFYRIYAGEFRQTKKMMILK